jgi:hypothetical protein
MSALWTGTLVVGSVGAVVLIVFARRLNREVAELQKAMRPLRIGNRRVGTRRPRSGRR